LLTYTGADRYFTIFSHKAEAGVSIPYPAISIHAIKQFGKDENCVPAVWMQLELADGGAGDDEFDTVDLTIVPPASSATTETGGDGSNSSQPEVSKLYEAISACSNLHPDPVDGEEDDEEDDRIIFEGSEEHEALEGFTGVMRGAADGGLPPPLPGSSGWITAENVHEYFDEDGNWIGEDGVSGELGEGAGRVRERDEVDSEEVNGHTHDDDPDSKRPRVD
jgi:chloride channel, nucleotide-sensitive, 1A